MKKVFIVFGSLVLVILLAAILLPIIFKDDIRAAIDKEINGSLNANVYYDTDAFGVSVFKHFPNITASVGDFGIAGIDQFEGDTLLDVANFEITLDIMSVISGDQINIISVLLDRPDIKVFVLEDGSANYDIVKETDESPATEEHSEPGKPLDIRIQKWIINEANILYDDLTIPFYTILVGFTHEGSGDFREDVFDMVTTTNIDQFYLGYDGDEYVSNKNFSADITMAMDLANMKFTFKENKLALNDFGFGFDGFISMPDENIDMDIQYSGQEIDLRSIISLIPGVYLEYLDGIAASGNVGFDGYVTGTYNEKSMPKVKANFSVENGKIAYADYPIPMEQINISAAFDYPSADLKESSFIMDNFAMSLDGEKLTASLIFKDFEDYFWDFKMNGGLDLEKITKIIPLEQGMDLKGKITATLSTSGRMSDLDAERYEKLPASGELNISNFYFSSTADLPQGFGIAEASMTFDPKAVALTKFKGNAGKTDLNMNGSITNHLQYILGDSTKLYGTLNFTSSLVDVNEWMVEEEDTGEETSSTDTAALEVVRIPEDIDFVLASTIDQILYDDFILKNFAGNVIVRDGAVRLEKVNFNMLDGYFEMDGLYNSASSLDKPIYDFDLQIKEMSIASAFKSFTTIQKLAPVAEKMAGKFSTNFKVGGTLGEDMMPIYEDMVGAGLVNIAQASLQEVKVLSAVSSVTKLNQQDGEVSIKDIIMSTEIKGGRLHVQPFDITLGGRSATVSGSTGLDGSLQYGMMMNVPSGQVGESLNSAISSLIGANNLVSSSLDLTLGITGDYNDPKVKLLSAKPAGSDGSASLKSALKTQASDEVAKQKEVVTQKVEAAKDSAKAVVDEKVAEAKEEVKEQVDETKQEVEEKAKEAVKNLFRRK